jgi:hypothetical protein
MKTKKKTTHRNFAFFSLVSLTKYPPPKSEACMERIFYVKTLT